MQHIPANALIGAARVIACGITLLAVAFPIGTDAVKPRKAEFTLAEPVILDEVNPEHYYSVFSPVEAARDGGFCAFLAGADLAVDPDAKHYETCFINDPGVFEVIELSGYFPANYEDSRRSEFFVGSERVVMLP